MAALSKILSGSKLVDSKGESDTIKLWESYREQAALWRSIALFQFLAVPLVLIFALYIYATRTITLHVPPRPLPGHYSVSEIPESEFISTATEFVNLIASYQPKAARPQFQRAMQMLSGAALKHFEDEMLGIEIKAIESTQRTQLFFIDPTKTTVSYQKRSVVVTFVGERLKLVAARSVPSALSKFQITLETVPRNALNPYGIVVSEVQAEDIGKK